MERGERGLNNLPMVAEHNGNQEQHRQQRRPNRKAQQSQNWHGSKLAAGFCRDCQSDYCD